MIRTHTLVKLATLALALAFSTSQGWGAQQLFIINADGEKEVTSAGVPNQGDLDASAIGTILLDNGTGSGNTGSATLELNIALIDGSLLFHHIHQAPSTTNGGVVLDFGNPNTILTGTPTAGVIAGTIPSLSAETITGIFANPTNFYYNLHSSVFQGGAVRDQLPEPASLGMLGLGAMVLLARRRGAQVG